ncbi:hypothetical protein ES288_A06G000500v1 [Gossypium darwinii]|uniref:Uncharacterized protein n=1 Tax=Gossypium darwinii TaxID=34276 RepID=A0A5D2G0A4_GOSDA|nr:hypothetical protein ES288_A06G000500v1 [Gossypium darwinii]
MNEAMNTSEIGVQKPDSASAKLLLRILLIDSSMKITFNRCIRDGDLIIAHERHDTMKAVKGSADELNRGYFDDISELKQNGGKIALANKILIPGIAARKFPAVDVIYSDGRKSKLPTVFDASGVDASKLAVPEASLVCLSFRANSQGRGANGTCVYL